jgi:SOS response regulatory protein OraA/RecX
MDANEFSEKLMKLSIEIQNASQDKQKAFARLFTYSKEALEKGFTQEEIQIIVVTAFQIQSNPELKQLWSILMGSFEIDPEDEFQ